MKVGDLPVKLSAQGEKLFGAYVIHGKIEVPKTSPRELMKSFDIEAPTTSDPKAFVVLRAAQRLPAHREAAAVERARSGAG